MTALARLCLLLDALEARLPHGEWGTTVSRAWIREARKLIEQARREAEQPGLREE